MTKETYIENRQKQGIRKGTRENEYKCKQCRKDADITLYYDALTPDDPYYNPRHDRKLTGRLSPYCFSLCDGCAME